MSQFEQSPSANMQAAKGLGKLIAIVIILAVTALGDVMYLQLMSAKFPSGGPLLVMCYLGAFASFFAMCYLLIGKTISFRPGAQTIAAWVLLAGELVIGALNVMLVFAGTQHLSGFMEVWYNIAPATPFIIMAGVVIVFFLDPELRKKHEDMEVQDNIDKLERQFKLMQYRTELKLKQKTLNLTEQFLMEELQDASNQEMLRGNAAQMFAQIVSGFSGFEVTPRIRAARVVESQSQSVQLAQTGSIDTSAQNIDTVERQTEQLESVNTSSNAKKKR